MQFSAIDSVCPETSTPSGFVTHVSTFLGSAKPLRRAAMLTIEWVCTNVSPSHGQLPKAGSYGALGSTGTALRGFYDTTWSDNLRSHNYQDDDTPPSLLTVLSIAITESATNSLGAARGPHSTISTTPARQKRTGQSERCRREAALILSAGVCAYSCVSSQVGVADILEERPRAVHAVCGICGKGFHVLRGRHHCRHCGISVCGKHSSNKAIVPSSLSSQRQRVCDTCFPVCQSGVTRRRRKTVGARSISFKYETDSSGTILTTTSTSQFTDYESTITTVTTTSSTPASSVYDPPSRRQNRKIISLKRQQQQQQPRSPRQDVPSSYFTTPEDFELEPVREQQAIRPQRQRQRQQQQRPRPTRRRASTSATKPKALQRHADSMSSSGSSSFSSLHDYSDDDSECEELIAKYLRRGAPITTLSSSNGSTKRLGQSRVDSTPLEAIKEKHSLENPTQLDTVMKALHQTPPFSASAVTGRTLQNRTMSTASAGTVSVTDSEEAEDSSDDARSDSDCDEEPVDEGHGDPSTPPARTLETVAPIQPAAVTAATAAETAPPAKRVVLPVAPEKPRVKKISVPKPTAIVVAAVPYKITEQDRCVMGEIAALELEIQKYQSELPELLEYLKKTERTAARLQKEAHESKVRVQQYKKAHCVVNRSTRNARALMKEQEYQAAILELLRASGIDRSSTTVWFLLAECRLKVGQLEDAEMACRKCFRLTQHACDRGGSGAACVALLGKILHEQGRHDEAIECYLTALKR